MNAVKCEMCGSNDIIKQGDFFVCRCCGIKYTPESAKQLFVQSTIRIDNSDRVRNLFDLARRAFRTGDYASCAAHYNELKFECPNNWEVIFYGEFCSVANLPYRAISSGIDKFERIMIAVYELVCQTNDKQTAERIIYDISMLVDKLACGYSKRIKDAVNNAFNPSTKQYVFNCNSLANLLYTCAYTVQRMSTQRELPAYLLKHAVQFSSLIIKNLTKESMKTQRDRITSAMETIKSVYPDFERPKEYGIG